MASGNAFFAMRQMVADLLISLRFLRLISVSGIGLMGMGGVMLLDMIEEIGFATLPGLSYVALAFFMM